MVLKPHALSLAPQAFAAPPHPGRLLQPELGPQHRAPSAMAERQVRAVIGALRRECTDHLIVFNERHLIRCLLEYIERYYNVARPPLRLERNSPIPRRRETKPAAQLKATPVLGGLHHRYERAT